MSSVYVLEPPTKGKVVLQTTAGPLDIELWPKEAPKAARNFVQLSLDGYYDDTTFHRIVKSFMVQAGDPSGTGTGGVSIYGEPFSTEFHSRLRFTHRGLLATAGTDAPNSNNSQFFITLDRCDWLDRKHTIFGKVTGDTIYNLIQLGEIETDKDDRPVDPVPKILHVEVLWNPFDDMVPRKFKTIMDDTPAECKGNKKKTVKQLNLLSFGEEAEEEEQELSKTNIKIKSSHDVLDDPRLLRTGDNSEPDLLETKGQKELQLSVREALTNRKRDDQIEGGATSDVEDDADFDARMRRQVIEKKKKLGVVPGDIKQGKSAYSKRSETDLREDDEDMDEGRIERPDKLSLKKKGLGSEARANLAIKTIVDAQLLGPLEQQRQLYKQRKKSRHSREEATLAKLENFKTVLLKAKDNQAEKEKAAYAEEEDSGWLAHQLKFVPEAGKKDDMTKNDDPNQYVVYDPLLEKGKEKFNKMQAKIKRREREWAGKSIT